MNRVINFFIVYISLFLVEITVSFILLLVCSMLNLANVKANFDGVVLYNLWRILFCGIPLMMFFFLLKNYVSFLKVDYKPILFSIFNLASYILLLFISQSLWKNTQLSLEGIMFRTTSVAIFVAPLILGLIPYFKSKMIFFNEDSSLI